MSIFWWLLGFSHGSPPAAARHLGGVFWFWRARQNQKTPFSHRGVAAGHDEAIGRGYRKVQFALGFMAMGETPATARKS